MRNSMRKYLFATLLSLASIVHADEKPVEKAPYEQTILALIAFGVEKNKEVFKNPALLALAQKYKSSHKIKRLFMTYFKDREDFAEVMEKDATQKEAIRLFLKSIGQGPDNEGLKIQIELAPNNMVEDSLKGLLEEASISDDDLNKLTELAEQLSQRIAIPTEKVQS